MKDYYIKNAHLSYKNNNFSDIYKRYIKRQRYSAFNIETTHRCRLQCPFCQRQKKYGKEKVKVAGELSYSSLKKIYNFTNAINLCGQISDPIYHTNLLEILRIRKKDYPNTLLTIRTNGSGKKIKWWEEAYKLSDNYTYWVFGLDGGSQHTANIYRVGTSFDEVFEVMRLGAKTNANITWQFILFEHNEHELDTVKRMCKENKINLEVIYSHRWPDEKKHLGIKKSSLQKQIPILKEKETYVNS